MINISQKQQKIIDILLKNNELSSSQIHAEIESIKEKISLVTIKRLLSDMASVGFLTVAGSGRSTVYSVAIMGRVLADISVADYCAIEPDKRHGQKGFNFSLLVDFPEDILTDEEVAKLNLATKEYHSRTHDLPESIRKKELQRLIIELAWKSSKIEGNTYTLLDTEKLIMDNIAAPNHSKDETRMILNHKDAFEYVRTNAEQFRNLSRANIEELHRIMVKDLGVGVNIRKRAVGITGSVYRPLDNEFQIAEALDSLIILIDRLKSPYAKALMAVLGISYIQPFEDGNKRTGRLLANAVLMAHGLAPLSYRSVDEREYRESTLVFYELNSVVPLKNIFITQYDFAARNYAVTTEI
ncbi:MAG: Fic family protein [Candidatus Falkowbacteria bacterium]